MTDAPPSSLVDQAEYPHPCPRCGKVIANTQSAIHTCCVTQSPVDEAALEAAGQWFRSKRHGRKSLARIITDAHAEQRTAILDHLALVNRDGGHRAAEFGSLVDAIKDAKNAYFKRVEEADVLLDSERVVREKLVDIMKMVKERFLLSPSQRAEIIAALTEAKKLESNIVKVESITKELSDEKQTNS